GPLTRGGKVETSSEEYDPHQPQGESNGQEHHRDAQPQSHNHEHKARHYGEGVPGDSFSRLHQMSIRDVTILHGRSPPGNESSRVPRIAESAQPEGAKKPQQCEESHCGATIARLNLPALSKWSHFHYEIGPRACQAPRPLFRGRWAGSW